MVLGVFTNMVLPFWELIKNIVRRFGNTLLNNVRTSATGYPDNSAGAKINMYYSSHNLGDRLEIKPVHQIFLGNKKGAI